MNKKEIEFGIIIIDGSKTLFGKFDFKSKSKNVLEIINTNVAEFRDMRKEEIRKYIKKIYDSSISHFITHDCPNIKHLIICGNNDFKFYINKIIHGCLTEISKTLDIHISKNDEFDEILNQYLKIL